MTIIRNKGDLNLIEIAGEYGELSLQGKELYMVCPLPEHHDTNPSCAFNPDKQMWYCHGCQEGGDVFDLLMKIHGVDFRGALGVLLDKHDINYRPSGKPQAPSEKEDLKQVVDWACSVYNQYLKGRGGLYDRNTDEYRSAAHYLAERHFDLGDINRWGLGYSPHYPTALVEGAKAENVDLTSLCAAGLVKRRSTDEGPVYSDVFNGRVMVPVRDAGGRPIGFTARRISGGDRLKYINTSDTPIFHKSEILMNGDRALKKAREKQRIVIVEGPLDLLRVDKIGIPEVVCTMGTALTPYQADAIADLKVKKTILFGDGDNAGVVASVKRGRALLVREASVYVVQTPENEDPDSLGDRAPQVTCQAVSMAPNLIQFIYDYEKPEDAMQTAELAEYFRELLSEVDDVTRRDILSSEVQRVLGAKFETPKKKIMLSGYEEKKAKPENDPHVKRIELDIIRAMIQHWDTPWVLEVVLHLVKVIPMKIFSEGANHTLQWLMPRLEHYGGDYGKIIENEPFPTHRTSQVCQRALDVNQGCALNGTAFVREVTQWVTIEAAKHELNKLKKKIAKSTDNDEMINVLTSYVETSRRRVGCTD